MSTHRFSRYAERDPESVAVVDPQGRRWTRGEMARLANRISRALRKARFAPGDVLAIVAPNSCEYLTVYLAATQIGLYVVPINWHLSPPEIQHILEDSRPRALFADERFASTILQALAASRFRPDVLISRGSITGFQSVQELTSALCEAPVEDPVVGRPLLYTSATTGKPKGVVLPLADAERVLEQSIAGRIELGSLPETHVYLCVSMLYHGAPLDMLIVALHMGNVVVLVEGTEPPQTLLQLIDEHQVTQAYFVPTVFGRLLSLSDITRSSYSLKSLRRVVHGGAPCPVEIKQRMIAWLGPILWEVYGATEGAGTSVNAQEWLKYPGTVGKPIPGSLLKILSDEGEELPPGVIGTIYMTRWMGDRFHYLGDPEKTLACHRGDFFTAGDVGFVNNAGFLFICDRKIDMIISSGTKIYPGQIENVLASHPAVADCAVFGVPDDFTGEAVVALIQPACAGTPDRDLRLALLRHVARHLSPSMLPKHILFTDQVPREATGKLQKRRLRELYWRDGRPIREPLAPRTASD